MIEKGTYQHFKGNYYQVLHIARHSETEEYMVVYHPQDKPEDIWLRPLDMFVQTIEREGKHLERFKFIRS